MEPPMSFVYAACLFYAQELQSIARLNP